MSMNEALSMLLKNAFNFVLYESIQFDVQTSINHISILVIFQLEFGSVHVVPQLS